MHSLNLAVQDSEAVLRIPRTVLLHGFCSRLSVLVSFIRDVTSMTEPNEPPYQYMKHRPLDYPEVYDMKYAELASNIRPLIPTTFMR